MIRSPLIYSLNVFLSSVIQNSLHLNIPLLAGVDTSAQWVPFGPCFAQAKPCLLPCPITFGASFPENRGWSLSQAELSLACNFPSHKAGTGTCSQHKESFRSCSVLYRCWGCSSWHTKSVCSFKLVKCDCVCSCAFQYHLLPAAEKLGLFWELLYSTFSSGKPYGIGLNKSFLFPNTLRGACCTIFDAGVVTKLQTPAKISNFLSLFWQWSVLVRHGEESEFWWLKPWFPLTAWLHGSGPSEMLLSASLVRRPLVKPYQGLCGSE